MKDLKWLVPAILWRLALRHFLQGFNTILCLQHVKVLLALEFWDCFNHRNFYDGQFKLRVQHPLQDMSIGIVARQVQRQAGTSAITL